MVNVLRSTTMRGRQYAVYPRVGIGVILIKENHILLVKRKQSPNKNKWTFPGGMIELGEPIEQAVHREIYEECNLFIEIKKLIDTFEYIERDQQNKIKYHYIILEYLAQYLSGTLRAKSDISAVEWIHADRFPELDSTEGTFNLLNKINFFDRRPFDAP